MAGVVPMRPVPAMLKTIMIIFLVVAVIFIFLVYFFVPRDKSNSILRNNIKITFELPTEIALAHRPEMTLYQREKRRRKLMNDIFKLGFYSREAFERKQQEDEELVNTPYVIK